jgi:NTP pyrophosphatase (non-canonical NTP hydrolase)
MLNELSQQIHANNVEKGFYQGTKNIGEMLCLIHSEVSEALEADRKDRYLKKPISVNDLNKYVNGDLFKGGYDTHIKGTFEEEMADIIIRVLDLCAFKNIDIDAHVAAKMRYNSLREFMHGKKY